MEAANRASRLILAPTTDSEVISGSLRPVEDGQKRECVALDMALNEARVECMKVQEDSIRLAN